MTAIHIPRRHLIQPQGRVVVSPESRLSALLVGDLEVISGATLARQNGGGVGTYPQGVGLQFAKASAQWVDGFPVGTDWGKYSIVAQVFGAGTDTNYSNVFNAHLRSAGGGRVQLRHTASNWDFYHQSASGWTLCQGAGAYKNATVQTLVCTWDGAMMSLYIDGALLATSAASGYMAGMLPEFLSIGLDRDIALISGSYFDGVIGLLGLSNGVAWSRDYAQRVSADPWGVLLQADPLRIYSLPAGPITLNSLTMSAFTSSGARATLSLTR